MFNLKLNIVRQEEVDYSEKWVFQLADFLIAFLELGLPRLYHRLVLPDTLLVELPLNIAENLP